MSFDIEKTIQYWLEGAEYDLATAKSLIQAGRYPHALFFGHLALEKLLKALVVKASSHHAPHTHSLTQLAKMTELEISDVILDRLAEYTDFNLEARYPDVSRAFYQKCTEEFTSEKFEEIKQVYKWFRERL